MSGQGWNALRLVLPQSPLRYGSQLQACPTANTPRSAVSMIAGETPGSGCRYLDSPEGLPHARAGSLLYHIPTGSVLRFLGSLCCTSKGPLHAHSLVSTRFQTFIRPDNCDWGWESRSVLTV